jgi:hypothetical protein
MTDSPTASRPPFSLAWVTRTSCPNSFERGGAIVVKARTRAMNACGASRAIAPAWPRIGVRLRSNQSTIGKRAERRRAAASGQWPSGPRTIAIRLRRVPTISSSTSSLSRPPGPRSRNTAATCPVSSQEPGGSVAPVGSGRALAAEREGRQEDRAPDLGGEDEIGVPAEGRGVPVALAAQVEEDAREIEGGARVDLTSLAAQAGNQPGLAQGGQVAGGDAERLAGSREGQPLPAAAIDEGDLGGGSVPTLHEGSSPCVRRSPRRC